ncbi:MAG: hypothetical protein ACREJC_03470 [Tepidisphaeraceae bacterium]
MPAPFWIATATVLVITFGSPILITLVLLLVPGRKGKMRTERHVRHDDCSPEQVWAIYADRLTRDGFDIEGADEPARVRASLRRWPATDPEPPSNLAVIVEMEFARTEVGVSVQIAAWLRSPVFFDSGEGRFLETVLERLMSDDANRNSAPLAPTLCFMALCSLTVALVSITAMAILLLSSSATTDTISAVLAGTGLACVASIFLGREAMKQIGCRPTELLGRGIVLATYLLGAVGAALAFYALSGRLLGQWFKRTDGG